MSFTVDLYGSKRKAKKSLGVVTLAFYGLVAVAALFFLFEFVSVVWGVVSVNMRSDEIRLETERISSEIMRENEKLNRFVISKVIVEEITRLRRTEYDYKTKLDNVVALLPAGSRLDEISFLDKQAVEVKISSSNVDRFEDLEVGLYDRQKLTNAGFVGLFLLQNSRTDLGEYQSRYLFSVEANAR
jgi:hypothetical protein